MNTSESVSGVEFRVHIFGSAVERTRHTQDSQDQILVLAFRLNDLNR